MKPEDTIGDMLRYYSERAEEYESIYGFDDSGRRAELEKIESLVKSKFADKSVLEIACGSGYWTQILSHVANSITALDGSEEMLAVAREKTYGQATTTFVRGDAYDLAPVSGSFNSAIAGFWLSHVPKSRQERFIGELNKKLEPGSTVLLFDNNLVEGMGGEPVSLPGSEDSFKRRKLDSGAEYIIIKNYFSVDELQSLLSRHDESVEVEMGDWYWSAMYRTPV